jgi:hypothetical protein
VSAAETVKFVLTEADLPTHWYNLAADLPTLPPPPSTPGPGNRWVRPTSNPLSDGTHPPGSEPRALDRDPRAGSRRLPTLATDAALPSPSARACARYTSAHLLQVRRGQPGRESQAEHGGRPGLLQQAGRREAAHHRDRSGSVGKLARHGLRLLRYRTQGVYGAGQLSPEAVPAYPDGDLGSPVRPQPQSRHRVRPALLRAGSRASGKPRNRHFRGGRGRSLARGHQVLARERAQPRAPAPDGHRAGGAPAVRAGR